MNPRKLAKRKKAARQLAKEQRKVFLPDVQRKVQPFGQYIGYQISKHNIPNVWLETEGQEITIAVLDTGATVNHPDLQGVFAQTHSMIDDSDNVTDVDGHGTHCTGIITANNNEIGMVGVAPKCKIVAVKVLGDDGSGTLEDVAAGIHYAINQKVDLISMSLGAPFSEELLHDAVKAAYAAHIPIICAAGNSGDIGELDFPARYPETISIGALNENNIRAEFSQTGVRLDFMAPGVDIYSTYPGGYAVLSGTSMACPWAAGVVALMMAKHRTIGGITSLHTVEDVRDHLKKTAIDLQQAGKDNQTGYGLVDVTKAIQQIIPGEEPQPEPEEGAENMTPEQIVAKFNAWVDAYKAKAAQKTDLENQIKNLQDQLATVQTEITTFENQASEIDLLLT